jgi:hypothetical protein
MTSLDCSQVRRLLSDALADDISADVAVNVAAHLSQCAICRGVAEEFIGQDRLLSELAARQRSDQWKARVHRALATFKDADIAAARTSAQLDDECDSFEAELPRSDAGSPLLCLLGEPGRQSWGFLGNRALLFSILAALLFAVTAAVVLSRSGNKQAAVAVRSEMSKHRTPVSHFSSPAVFVARLAVADCQWVDPEMALGEGALLIAGQKLELASGHVEIVFQSGAEVKLHGPAIFEIRSANSGFLTIGRLSARAATPESHGFTVHSRTAATVDLGTEFNVVASDDGHSQIGVVEGAVEVQLANGRQRRRLGVGESIEVEPGTPSVIARIEPGENTPAFKFPTIEPPRTRTTPTPRRDALASAFSAAGRWAASAPVAPLRCYWTARGNPSPTRPMSRSSSTSILRE